MKKKSPRGRKRIEFTEDMWSQAEKMAYIQCTGEEIASILGVHYDTLEARLKENGYQNFSEWFKKHSAGGKMALRRRQFSMSERSVPMAIWLGKQYLGQSDQSMLEMSSVVRPAFDTDKMTKEEYKEFARDQFRKMKGE